MLLLLPLLCFASATVAAIAAAAAAAAAATATTAADNGYFITPLDVILVYSILVHLDKL